MRGRLDLQGLVLRLRLGVLPEEKLSERDVPLDISWTGELGSPPAIDYGDVCHRLAGLQGSDYDYIEDLAADVLRLLTGEFKGGVWSVRVSKPFPPAGLRLRSAAVTVQGGSDEGTGGEDG
ncbi:MAG: hypothetical protein AVO35_03560 [Candidatus Aegiribacteria sp. MLS_C]|nr:MAG: hypothetical protein AVO35_03560 [Candidatus Aegiribacteria sp. MLS_C]